jgi:ankyrin repeat protein
MQAVLSGHQDVVQLLVDSGADLSARNVYLNTALDLALARDLQVRGMLKIVLFLNIKKISYVEIHSLQN